MFYSAKNLAPPLVSDSQCYAILSSSAGPRAARFRTCTPTSSPSIRRRWADCNLFELHRVVLVLIQCPSVPYSAIGGYTHSSRASRHRNWCILEQSNVHFSISWWTIYLKINIRTVIGRVKPHTGISITQRSALQLINSVYPLNTVLGSMRSLDHSFRSTRWIEFSIPSLHDRVNQTQYINCDRNVFRPAMGSSVCGLSRINTCNQPITVYYQIYKYKCIKRERRYNRKSFNDS